MASRAVLAIQIITDATQTAAGMGKAGKETTKFQSRLQKTTKVAKYAAVGVAAIGAAAVKQASDLQQAAGAVEAVFGKQSGKIKALAKEAADAVGLSKTEYDNMAAVIGSQLGNMGIAQDQLVGKTDNLIKRGGDLAATFGGSTAQAVSALSAVFRGEYDPIERYGVSIRDADVKAQLAAKGQDKLTGKAMKLARAQALLTLLNKQTAKAAGQRAREEGSEQQTRQIALAKLKNAGASLGQILLPIIAAISTALGAMAAWVDKNRTAFMIIIGVIGGLAATVYAVNGAIAAYTAVTKIARAAVIVFRNAQLAFNLVMMANPIGLVVAAIALLVIGFVIAYRRSSKFRAVVQAVMRAAEKAIKAVWRWLKEKIPAALGVAKRIAIAAFRAWSAPIRFVIRVVTSLVSWLKAKIPGALRTAKAVAVAAFRAYTAPIRAVIGWVRSLIGWVRDKIPGAARTARAVAVNAFNALAAPIRAAIGWIRSLVGWLGRIKIPSLGGIGRAVGGILGRSSGARMAGAGARSLTAPGTARSLTSGTRALMGGGSVAGGGGGSGAPLIIVQGALDPDAVAKQIEKLLGRRRRRLGAASA